MTRGRWLLLGAAAACAVLAVAAALLARDVGRRHDALRAGDIAAAGGAGDWSVDETLPFAPARRLLGLDDDLAFREALMRFRRARNRVPEFQQSAAGQTTRLEAQTALAHTIRIDRDRARASAASNLLGILSVLDAAAAARGGDNSADRAIFAFRDAVTLDPRNEQAKTNLELLYVQRTLPYTVRGLERLQRSAHAGASASAPGQGY